MAAMANSVAVNGNNNVVFIGNPGAGKSTLLNSLVGKVAFKSGISIGTGLTSVLQTEKHNKVLYHDTPGLNDVEIKQQAADEIERALKSGGHFRLLFVMTVVQGRLHDSELATMRFILDHITQDQPPKFAVIINQIDPKVLTLIESDEQKFQKLFKPIYSFKWKPFHVIFLPKMSELDGETDMLIHPPPPLIDLLQSMADSSHYDIIQPEKVRKIKVLRTTVETYTKRLNEDTFNRDEIRKRITREKILIEIRRGAIKYRLNEMSKVHCKRCPYIRVRKNLIKVHDWTEEALCAICFDCCGDKDDRCTCSLV